MSYGFTSLTYHRTNPVKDYLLHGLKTAGKQAGAGNTYGRSWREDRNVRRIVEDDEVIASAIAISAGVCACATNFNLIPIRGV